MRLENAENILFFIYYKITNNVKQVDFLYRQFDRSIKEKMNQYADIFLNKMQKVYGVGFIKKLRKFYIKKLIKEDSSTVYSANDKYKLYALASSDKTTLSDYIVRRLACISDYGIEFLFAFNVKHEIIKELIPCLPKAEKTCDIASHIVAGTEAPAKFFLLAAATDIDTLKPGYILKNRRFQAYTFSIYKVKNDNYTFEFVSLQESFKGKIVHISIIFPHTEPEIIEEKCLIDTKQYTLYYRGKLNQEAEIKAAIITIK